MLFCSWLIYGCEQLRHLKESMHLMMQLSASEGVSMLSSDNTKEFILENHGAHLTLVYIICPEIFMVFFWSRRRDYTKGDGTHQDFPESEASSAE
jgi:hypothetical protein